MPTNVMVGYDGSHSAGEAITAGAALFEGAHAWVVYVWTPPFGSARLRRRLRATARGVDDLVELIEREGEREARATAAAGVALAAAAEWDAEPLVNRTMGSDGLRLAQLAETLHADVVIVGSRGLGGADAVLGSVSDLVVHYATVPVLVVPNPLLANEFDALTAGPVVVGYDGTDGAEAAAAAARRLFGERRLLLAAVHDEGEEVAVGPAASGAQLLSRPLPRALGAPPRVTADVLIECADEHDAAALVVGSRGRSTVRELVLGSVARAAVHRSHRPVLVVHG
ncbi:MAG: universal stress protein [Actinomycetota bacterium]|nr:universal stress protein [Actinomycetota bacterium]